MGAPTLLVRGNLKGAGGGGPPPVPIDYVIGWLKRRMPEFGGGAPETLADRALIVRSETGSGKSTVLPAYLMRLLRNKESDLAVRLSGPGVICTQPRILTAQTLARDQAADTENYPDLVMGVTVGYQTGPVNEMPGRGLIYATAGTLLAQLRVMPDADIIARYRFIVVDEAHERSLDIDSLLMRLKIFLKRNLGNPLLPFVLLASATLPTRKYAKYFELGPENVIEIVGRTFTIDKHFPAAGVNDYPRAAAEKALELHEANLDDPPEQADILIFVPGAREITEVIRHLGLARETTKPFLVLEITREEVLNQTFNYRSLKTAPGDLRVAFGGEMVRPARRIIVSTVVAETGLTIETLKYVVDCGWSRAQETYFPGEIRGLVTRPAPQSRIQQRMGRAGRKFPGQFHALYTQNVYEALPLEQLPEIVTEGVGPIFLDVVAATAAATAAAAAATAAATAATTDLVFRVGDIDMLDPPPVDALADALEKAITFGYLRATPASVKAGGHVLTRLGEVAGRFGRLRMSQVQTLLSGYLWRVSLRDLALVVALYETRGALIYAVPPYNARPAEKAEAEMRRQRALRAGLPDYLVKPPAVLGGGDRPPPPAEEHYYRARLLISDDFLEALLVFEGFARALDRTSGDLKALLDWCEENGVDFEGATQLTIAREKVMEELLGAGLNPFWGEEYRLADAPPAEFFDTVVRLKSAIHAGLRHSTLTYDAEAAMYRTRTGDPVEVPPAYTDAEMSRLRGLGMTSAPRPARLATSVIQLRPAAKSRDEKVNPLLYRRVPGLVSVLDGYVDVDAEADAPRARA